MPQPTAEDIKLLGILVSRGMITPDQSTRVKRVLESGMELIDALQTTALVEPLQFMKAKQISQAQDTLPKAPVERDKEGVNVMDLDDDLELDYDSYKPTPLVPDTGEVLFDPTPDPSEVTPPDKLVDSDFDLEADFHDLQTGPSPHHVPAAEPEPEEPKYVKLDTDFDFELDSSAIEGSDDSLDDELELPGMSKEDVRRPSSEELAKASLPVEPIALPRDSTGFIRPGMTPAVFDLKNDEGIAVIGHANHLLAGVIKKTHTAVLLRQLEPTSRTDYLDQDGRLAESEEMGPEAMSKVLNRLKVMARIEPWRKTSLTGAFYLLDNGIEYTAMVESATRDGEDTLLITMRPGRV